MSEHDKPLPRLIDSPDDVADGVVASPTGLALPEGMSFERWTECGLRLERGRSAVQWCIGDWWAYGARFGERRHSALAQTGLDYHTCENYAVVARAFVGSRWAGALSFAHHETVAALPSAEADRLLDWCAETMTATGKPRTRQALRDEVARLRLIEADAQVLSGSRRIHPLDRRSIPGTRAPYRVPDIGIDAWRRGVIHSAASAAGPTPRPAVLDWVAALRNALADLEFEEFVGRLDGLTLGELVELEAAVVEAQRRQSSRPAE